MAKDEDAETPEKSGGKKKIILILVPVLLIVGGCGWFFLLRGKGDKKPEAPKPGVIVHVEPITVNLEGGHFLKVGFGLQQTADVAEELDTAKATDIMIATLSNMSIDELTSADDRAEVKQELVEKISEAYEKEIYDLYFTEFVMQ